MSTTDKTPAGWRLHLGIGVALALGIVVLALGLVAFLKEDHRVTYDKEGRYLPFWSLKELALAMHGYHEKHGRLPPTAVYNQQGTPLLSWRVLILPHLDEGDELFRQFKLDEPWDSPHNTRLLPKMPRVYSPLEGNPPLDPHTTLFQVFVGKGTAFEGREGLRFKEDFPRLSYTVLIVEAGKSVPWTKPEDIPYDENQPLPKLGGYFKESFHVAMGDCTAFPIRQGAKQEAFRAAILRNGNGPLLWK